MSDCASCKFSVANDPGMAGKQYRETPCFTCTACNPNYERAQDPTTVSLTDAIVSKPGPRTWAVSGRWLADRDGDVVREPADVLLDYSRLSAAVRHRLRGKVDGVLGHFHKVFESYRDEEILIQRLRMREEWTYAEVGRNVGLTRQAIHQRMPRIEAKLVRWQMDSEKILEERFLHANST